MTKLRVFDAVDAGMDCYCHNSEDLGTRIQTRVHTIRVLSSPNVSFRKTHDVENPVTPSLTRDYACEAVDRRDRSNSYTQYTRRKYQLYTLRSED